MQVQHRLRLFHEAIELVQAQLERGHIGDKVAAQVVILHEPHQRAKGLFVRHVEQKGTDNELHALAVPTLGVV